MKKIITIFMPLMLLVASIGGNAAEHGFIKNTKRIGVLTVTMTKVGDDRQANVDTRQAILGHADSSFTAILKSLSDWEVVSASEMSKLKGINQLNKLAGQNDVKKKLKKLADQDQLPIEDEKIVNEAVAATLTFNKEKIEKLRAKAIGKTEKEMQSKVKATAKRRQALAGSPNLALGLVEGNFGNRPETQQQIALIDEIFSKRVSEFCKQNQLDGVAIFYVSAEAGHVGDVFVTNGERTNGHVKANTSVRLMHQNQKLNYSHGFPRMDDLAPFFLNTPIYVGAGHVSAKPENIDLADPNSETLNKYKELIDKANKKLSEGLRKKLGLK